MAPNLVERYQSLPIHSLLQLKLNIMILLTVAMTVVTEKTLSLSSAVKYTIATASLQNMHNECRRYRMPRH